MQLAELGVYIDYKVLQICYFRLPCSLPTYGLRNFTMNTSMGLYRIMSLAPYRAGPCPNSNTLPRAHFNRFGNFVFVFAFVFVFDFSSLFAIAPFVVAVFAIGRAANGQNSWRQSGSTARRKAEAPPKLHRSSTEAQSNLSRTLGAPFELVRSASGFS